MTRSTVPDRPGRGPRQLSRATGASCETPGREGPLPELDVDRQLTRADGLVRIPANLLFGGYPDVGVLTWCLLRLDFGSGAASACYADLAERLGMRRSAAAIDQLFCGVFSSSIQPAWIRRDRGDGRFTYQAVLHHRSAAEDAVLGRSDLRLLDRDESVSQRVTCADLADFARWQTVCHPTGWTAESSEDIALRWGVSPNTVLRSKRRLVQLGILEVTHRQAARHADIVWIAELHDPVEAERIEGLLGPTRGERIQRKISQQHVSADVVPLLDLLRSLPRQPVTLTLPEIQMMTGGRLPVDPRRYRAWWSTFSRAHAEAWARADIIVEPDLLNGRIRFWPTSLTIPDVAALHKRRRNRRDRSKRRLLSKVDDAVGGSDDALTLPHVVYLVHIPAKNTFKVGIGCYLTARTRSVCEQWKAILIDQVVVANRHFALMIEADVLDLVEEWHQLGDMGSPAGGFTEMWSADGPTVDLHTIVQSVTDEISAARPTTPAAGSSPTIHTGRQS